MAVIAKFKKTKHGKEKPRTLRSVPTLPTLFTLANLGCGFAAIHFALRAMFAAGAGEPRADELVFNSHVLDRMVPSFLTLAAIYIFLGMFCDLLDGLVARMTRRTSDFGGQLDSLADMVNSGVAPAILVVALMMRDLQTYVGAGVPGPFGSTFMGRFAWVTAMTYAAGTAVRLARYNVEHVRPDFSHKIFTGLPCPGAAALVASLVILQDAAGIGSIFHRFIILGLPFVTVALAILMVSRIPYARLGHGYLRGRQPFEHIMVFMVIVVVFMVAKEATLSLLVCWYVLSGPVGSLWRWLRPSAIAQPALETAESIIPRAVQSRPSLKNTTG